MVHHEQRVPWRHSLGNHDDDGRPVDFDDFVQFDNFHQCGHHDDNSGAGMRLSGPQYLASDVAGTLSVRSVRSGQRTNTLLLHNDHNDFNDDNFDINFNIDNEHKYINIIVNK